MKILVTGCSGYIGSLLVPFLLADGHHVRGFDIGWFGDGFLPKDNGHFKLIKGDVRDQEAVEAAVKGMDAVIHLASVSNDTSCQLDEALSTSINFDAFEPLVIAAKDAVVKRFIFASSSSVYGTSDAESVTEEHPLKALTLYNKFKGMCEPLLFKHNGPGFCCTAVRPATVCGRAPRQRFDLSMNMMVNHACQRGEISVHGGDQMRAHVHIRDMVDCYRVLLATPVGRISGQAFNLGHANLTVRSAAELVADVVARSGFSRPAIKVEPRQDERSYTIDSGKIFREVGFTAWRPVEGAIEDLCLWFKEGRFRDSLENPWYMNILQLLDKRAA